MIKNDKNLSGDQVSNRAVNVSDCKNTQIVFTNDKILSSLDDENSIVAFFLDTFNLKKFIETVANSQSYFKITHNFINIILLIFFLAFVFWENEILKLEKTSATMTLMVLGFGAIFEFLGANTSIFKGFLDSDTKTKKFIDGLPALRNIRIEKEVTRLDFSPRCLNYFIKKLEDINIYSQSVVFVVLDSQSLRKENLDLLFSTEIIKNLSKKLILTLLFRYKNSLTQENMKNIYNNFHLDNDVMKILIATQEYSDFLIKLHSEDSKLSKFYQRYQTEKVYMDWKLKIIPINKLSTIRKVLTFLILFVSWILIFGSSDYTKSPDDFFLFSLFISVLITESIQKFTLRPTSKIIHNYYFKHMISNIIKDET